MTLSVFLISSLILNGFTVLASNGQSGKPKEITKTYEYTTKKENEKQGKFDKTIKEQGATYKLKDIQYEVVSKEAEKVTKEMHYQTTSEPVIKGSEGTEEKTITKDGITYTLDTVNEVETEPYIQEVTGYTDYQYEVSNSTVPQQKEVTAKNEKTGEDETVTCQLNGVEQTGTNWVDSYIDITFESYNSKIFNWQGISIKNEDTNVPLSGYEAQLLSSVGLDNSNAKVISTYWTSEAYTSNGIVCRDARANIQKQVPIYRATYIGKIQSSMVIREAIYKGQQITTDEKNVTYHMKATAVYTQDNMLLYIGIGIFIAAILLILILFILAKKKKEKEVKK